LNIKIRITDRM